jgi:hypothetical protein
MPKQTIDVVQANFTAALASFPQIKLEGPEGDKNFAMLASYMKNHGDDWSVNKIVDALHALKNSMYKYTPAELAQQQQLQAATATEPVEVLDKLPNGEDRLPLDASDFAMRKASKAQLHDLTQRQYAASSPSKTLFVRPSHQKNQGGF